MKHKLVRLLAATAVEFPQRIARGVESGRMSAELIATVLTGVGVLIGVSRMVEGVRRDLANRIDAVDRRVDAVNTRIDAILLADRRPSTT